jgi:hypothetical protein
MEASDQFACSIVNKGIPVGLCGGGDFSLNTADQHHLKRFIFSD